MKMQAVLLEVFAKQSLVLKAISQEYLKELLTQLLIHM